MSIPELVAAAVRPGCEVCMGTGWVCEDHPNKPWDWPAPVGCDLAHGPGMPCRCTGLDGPSPEPLP